MRIDLHIHSSEGATLLTISAAYQAEIDRLNAFVAAQANTIKSQAAQIVTLTNETSTTVDTGPAVDAADTAALGSALDAAGAPPIPPATPVTVPFAIEASTLDLTAGEAVSVQLEVVGAVGNVSFTPATSADSTLSLNATGLITGTAGAAGSDTTLVVEATDSSTPTAQVAVLNLPVVVAAAAA